MDQSGSVGVPDRFVVLQLSVLIELRFNATFGNLSGALDHK
jgi:hypothetical protein